MKQRRFSGARRRAASARPGRAAPRSRAGAGSPSPDRARTAPCPAPSSVTRRPCVASASAAPRASGTIASASPWITSDGHRTRAQSSRTSSTESSPGASSVAISVSGVVSSPQPMQSSICLVECGSVNRCPKKNSRKPRKSASQECRLKLVPALARRDGGLVEVDVAPGCRGASGTLGAMKTAPSTRSGCSAASMQRPVRRPPRCETTVAPAPRRPRRARPARRRRTRGSSYAAGLGRAIGAAVAAPVEGDDPHVARKVRHLRLPHAGVDDRPGSAGRAPSRGPSPNTS